MVTLRALFFFLGLTLAAPAIADCFDTPSWHGEPLTHSYLDSLGDDPERKVRRASLNMLLVSAESANDQLNDIQRLLMRTALLQHDGDRGALRKKLQSGTLHDVIQLVDFSRSNPGDQNKIVAAYWLNGCVEEALGLLTSSDNPLTGQNYMPIATGDSALLRTFAEREETGGYQQRRLLAFAEMLERPDTKEQTLQSFLDYLASEAKVDEITEAIDYAGLKIALNVARGQQPELELLPNELSFDSDEVQANGMRFSAFVAWMSAAGFCEATSRTAYVLLGASAEGMPFNRELLEASFIRCLATR